MRSFYWLMLLIGLVLLTTCNETSPKHKLDNKPTQQVTRDTTKLIMSDIDTTWKNIELAMRVSMIQPNLVRANAYRDSLLIKRTGKSFRQHLRDNKKLMNSYTGFWKIVEGGKEKFIFMDTTYKGIVVNQMVDGSFAASSDRSTYKFQPLNTNGTLFEVLRRDTTIATLAYVMHTNSRRPLFSDGRTMAIRWTALLN